MNEKAGNTVKNECYPELLSNLINNRVKLMQEVLNLIKPKKMMSMAPDHMKNMQLSFVKSLLLEELLGISNKRLRNILAGENNDSDSSSSSETIIETQDCDTTFEDNNKHKQGNRSTNKSSKKRKISDNKPEEPVVNVLNLLELQARARAIRSQLANEGLSPKIEKNTTIVDLSSKSKSDEEHSSSNSVICISPEHNSVVSVKSGSDSEKSPKNTEEVDSEKSPKNTEEVDSEKSPKNTEEVDSEKSPKNTEEVDSEKSPKNTEEVDSEKSPKNNTEEVDKEKTPSVDVDSWKNRWLQSEKVQNVMKSMKFSNNLRHSRKKKIVL